MRMKKAEVGKNKRRFLKALEKNAFHIGRTCKSLGISRMTVYGWRKYDPEFADELRFWTKDMKEDDRAGKAFEEMGDAGLFGRSEAGDVKATLEGLRRYGRWNRTVSPQEMRRLEKQRWLNRNRRYHYFNSKPIPNDNRRRIVELVSSYPLSPEKIKQKFAIREQPRSGLSRFEATLDSLKSYSLVEIVEGDKFDMWGNPCLIVKVVCYLGRYHRIERAYDEAVRRGYESALFEKV